MIIRTGNPTRGVTVILVHYHSRTAVESLETGPVIQTLILILLAILLTLGLNFLPRGQRSSLKVLTRTSGVP